MLHLFRYSILASAREHSTMFWALLFPILLGFLFTFALSGTNDTEVMKEIPTGVVTPDLSEDSMGFRSFLEEQDGGPLILTAYDSEEEAARALKQKVISGYFLNGEKQQLVVGGTGLGESILTQMLDTWVQNKSIILDIAKNHPEKLPDAAAAVGEYTPYTEDVSPGGQTLDNFVTYFFALLAMACLYGSFLGLDKGIWLQAYSSPLGARRCISPTHKFKFIFTDFCAIAILHYINLMILLLFIRFVFQIDLGNRYGLLLLIILMGDIIGISFGFIVGSIGRLKEGFKLAIVLGISMLLSFMSGLMFSGIKQIVEEHAPILNRINPAALITDAFYCIVVYDNPSRLAINLLILGVMSAVMILISFLVTRRVRYDSI